jgi:uncharacterized membrane protein YkoI
MKKMDYMTGVAALVLGMAVGAQAGEKEIAVDQLPAPVVAAAQQAYPGWKLEEAKMEKEEGVVVYEVELESGEQECELTITPEGAILETKTEVEPEALPENIRMTLSLFANAEVKEAAKEEEGGKVTYEVELIQEDQMLEIEFSAAGSILEVQAKPTQSDEDDDDQEENDDD